MKKGWRVEKLGDVCDIVNGSTPLRSNKSFWENGDISWFTIDDIRAQGRIITETKQKVTQTALEKASLRMLPVYSVLLCCTASIGEYAITEIPLSTNQQFNGLVIKDQKLLSPYYLFHYCATLKDKLLTLSGKTTIDFIPISRLREIEIPIPPIPEQQRIVAVLNEAFASIAQVKANAERNLVNARELFGSYIESLFADSRTGWEEKKLGDVCERITDGTHVTPTYVPDGVPFLSVKNLTKGFIDFSDTRFITPEEHQILTKRVRPERDDLLYTKVGTTGIAKVVDVDVEFSIFVSIALLKLKHEMIFNKYLEFFLNSPFARKQAQQRTRGMANKNLVITDIKEIEIHFPKSLTEQRAIVGRLEALSAETGRLEAVYRQKVAGLDELKKSVLQKAFAGEI